MNGEGNPRLDIPEFVAKHELEPSLIDVVTEAGPDAAFFSWFLRSNGIDARVLPSKDFKVPKALLTEHGLTTGVRSNTIAIGNEVHRLNPGLKGRIACIVDRDFDDLLETNPATSPLLYCTDYTSLEAYCFTHETIEKLMRTCLGIPQSITCADVMDGVLEALTDVYLVRASLHLVECGFSVAKPIPSCSLLSGPAVKVDVPGLVGRSVNQAAVKDAVLAKYEELKASPIRNPQERIHGHDLPRILGWALRSFVTHVYLAREECMRAMLLGCLGELDLREEPLFKALLTDLA